MKGTRNTFQSKGAASRTHHTDITHFGVPAVVALAAFLSLALAHPTLAAANAPALQAAESSAVPDASGAAESVDANTVTAPPPIFASVDAMTAFVSNRTVTVQWRTSSELGTIGFNLLRWDPAAGAFRQLNDTLLPGVIVHPEGGVYRYRDDEAPLEGTLTYKLIEVEFQGRQREHGPFTIDLSSQAAPETENREAEGARWADDVIFQGQPNGITGEHQDGALPAMTEQLGAVEAEAVGTGGTAKITTRGEGLYYVSALLIGSALGITTGEAATLIANGQVDLTSQGADVAYVPRTDEGSNGLYFYANQPQTIYSAESAYMVTASRGTTMAGAPTGTGGTTATSFASTLHREENHYALPILFTDPDGDFWCWDYVVAGSAGSDRKSFTMHVPGVAGTGKASLTVHLHGGSDTSARLDHHAVIFWNGTQVGETRWNGTTARDLKITLGPAAVQEGDNTLELQGVLDAGVPYSIVYLDSFDLTYQRLFRADGNELNFTAPTSSTVTVGGFSSRNILVLDLGSSTQQPSVVTPTITAAQDGTYQAQFVTPSGRTPRSYLALVKGRVKTPVKLGSMQFAGLKNQSNRADYVLIAPNSLLAATRSLAAYRSAQGLVTMVVALDDIYNEFNDGNASPYAIQDFLSYAVSKWHTRPRYATLVGRGTFDYQNYKGFGDCLVPPLMTATPYGLFVSDNRLADLTGNDGVPEIALGRLPVLTSQDVTDYLAKIQTREQAPNPRQVLMAADNPDGAGSFNADSDAVAALVPSGYKVLKVYLPAYTGPGGEQAIINAINTGVTFFNYIGHGGPTLLADEKLFQTSDVSALTNATVMPMFLGMTCAAGNFGFPGYPSLAETMLVQQGGGIYASWASSGLSENTQAVLLNKAFFTAAFGRGTKTVGDAISSALRSRSAAAVPPSMKHLYNLLGEPVSRVL